ncbi:DUF262 domain-containing protein [Lactiplantibacillus fabifermentans]|uniref:GmrSD restriction endonucleases N-terminal domain-containing protein n=1 Tax=Lactiplantibacillus fabifermentans DSM 21115 TaxID=1413187 RepID=A0A0R2NXZ9_9LACO|nr:DUF262 domain-containing protein [Lactiplantibacillus fabifermentans]KRO29307.1 hypothetical protein DY78_GL000914 [Lactiplantibacillus fabifermentans DSM 21115]
MNAFVEIPQPSRFRINELFHDNKFIVPLYQRNYAWETNEIEDFWSDLEDIVNGKRNNHFFGQIVTYRNNNNEQEIIDGQQRLTTSTIFMAVIRDIANEIYTDLSKNPANALDAEESGDELRDIRNQVKKSIRGEKGDASSLTVQQHVDDDGESLQTFFFNLTHSNSNALTTKTNSEPKKNMQKAYRDMYSWILKSLKLEKTLSGRINKLKLTFESFFEDFYIVMISAPSRRDAFTIFETLNSRGKDLKASDIIKNHVMSLMSDDLEQANQTWTSITSKLDNDSNRITRFIRTYWASKKRIVSEAKLYREISSEVDNINSAKHFLTDLEKLVDLYTVLESPTQPKAHARYFNNETLTQQLDILNRMRVLLYYPIVLSLQYTQFSEDKILKIVRKVTSVFIRHRTIMNQGTNKLESGFSDVAQKIWTLQLRNVDDINNYINEHLIPSDDQIKTNFNALAKDGGQRGAKKWTLVYLLAELYDATFDDFGNNDLYLKAFNDDNYRLVQISTDQNLGDYQNYIGNWTILEKNLSEKEYASVSELTVALLKSDLNANHVLAKQLENGIWNSDAIKTRQNTLSNSLTVIW